jgi:signal recognition particle receptor subunit beta
MYAKLVYYGPALGGKTTNLRVLHDETDPERQARLVSVNTADDRTLFFDLLPFDLGSVLGYKVALKLYTVPGQVRYDATRRVVLAGADAVVFVADSDPGRERDNRQAWENLSQNMRATRLDPANVPILVQFNKRDLPGAVPEEKMRAWFDFKTPAGIPAVACQGTGVLETFLSAAHAMIERIVALAEPLQVTLANTNGCPLTTPVAGIAASPLSLPMNASGSPATDEAPIQKACSNPVARISFTSSAETIR